MTATGSIISVGADLPLPPPPTPAPRSRSAPPIDWRPLAVLAAAGVIAYGLYRRVR